VLIGFNIAMGGVDYEERSLYYGPTLTQALAEARAVYESIQTDYQFRTSLVPLVHGAALTDVAVRSFFSFRNPYQAAKEAVSLDLKTPVLISVSGGTDQAWPISEAVDSLQRSSSGSEQLSLSQ